MSLSRVIKYNIQLCHLIFSLWKQRTWIVCLIFFFCGKYKQEHEENNFASNENLAWFNLQTGKYNCGIKFLFFFILQFPWHKCSSFPRKSIIDWLCWARLDIPRISYPLLPSLMFQFGGRRCTLTIIETARYWELTSCGQLMDTKPSLLAAKSSNFVGSRLLLLFYQKYNWGKESMIKLNIIQIVLMTWYRFWHWPSWLSSH